MRENLLFLISTLFAFLLVLVFIVEFVISLHKRLFHRSEFCCNVDEPDQNARVQMG